MKSNAVSNRFNRTVPSLVLNFFRRCRTWFACAGLICQAGPRLRPDDLGQLWEHYVLNEFTAQLQTAGLRYWRDKQGQEVGLIRAPRGKSPTAIEGIRSARDFNPANLLTLRPRLSKATLLVMCSGPCPEAHSTAEADCQSLRPRSNLESLSERDGVLVPFLFFLSGPVLPELLPGLVGRFAGLLNISVEDSLGNLLVAI
jgi:hypothetical protein